MHGYLATSLRANSATVVIVIVLLTSLMSACSSTTKQAASVAGEKTQTSAAEPGNAPPTEPPVTSGTTAPATPADAVLASLRPEDTLIRFDFSFPITYGYVKSEKEVEYLEFLITADGTGIARETEQMRYRQLQVNQRDLVTALNKVISAGFGGLPEQIGPVVTTRRPTQTLGSGTISVVVAPGVIKVVDFEGLYSELATNGVGSMPDNAKTAISAIGDLIFQVKNKGKQWVPSKIRLLSDGIESLDDLGITPTGAPKWPTNVPVPAEFAEPFVAYEPDQVRAAQLEGTSVATLLPLFSSNGTAVLLLPGNRIGSFFWQPVV